MLEFVLLCVQVGSLFRGLAVVLLVGEERTSVTEIFYACIRSS